MTDAAPFTSLLGRRTLLKGLAGGALALSGAGALAAARGPRRRRPGASAASKTATLGSSGSDDVPKRAIQAMVDAFETKSGDTVKVNTVPHNDFQNNISSYLQGSPDDAFTWFAGYRMRYYAAKELCAPLDDVWETIGGQLLRGHRQGLDRRRRQEVLRPDLQLPVGLLLPQERVGRQGLFGAGHVRRAQDPVRQDEGGRADPDRVRRQGRLAGHGHVRLPEHAAQRLPVPRRSVRAQGELGPAEGQGRLRQLEADPAVPRPRRRSARPGRTPPRPWPRRSPGCICSDPS